MSGELEKIAGNPADLNNFNRALTAFTNGYTAAMFTDYKVIFPGDEHNVKLQMNGRIAELQKFLNLGSEDEKTKLQLSIDSLKHKVEQFHTADGTSEKVLAAFNAEARKATTDADIHKFSAEMNDARMALFSTSNILDEKRAANIVDEVNLNSWEIHKEWTYEVLKDHFWDSLTQRFGVFNQEMFAKIQKYDAAEIEERVRQLGNDAKTISETFLGQTETESFNRYNNLIKELETVKENLDLKPDDKLNEVNKVLQNLRKKSNYASAK